MVSNKIIAVLAASSALALFAVTSASADPIVKEEQEQIGNSAAPDVDPGASKGPDKPIVKQEKNQLDNSMSTDVPEPSMKGGEFDSGPGEKGHRVGAFASRLSVAEHSSHRRPVDRVWLINVCLIQRLALA